MTIEGNPSAAPDCKPSHRCGQHFNMKQCLNNKGHEGEHQYDLEHDIAHAYLSAGDNPYASGDRPYTGCSLCGAPRSEHRS